MGDDKDDLGRVLRTIKRSLEAADSTTTPPDETTKLLLNSVNQLVFLVEKLLEDSRKHGDS